MSHAWVCVLAASALCAAAQPNAGEIVRRSVSNTLADWNAAPQYDFTERDVVTLKARTIETYRVIMIEGSPYNELIAANGNPLDPARAAAESRKLQEEIARRRRETPSERRQRIARYNRERRQDNQLLEKMIKAIDFKVVGEDTIDGRRCFVLEGAPKAGYCPHEPGNQSAEGYARQNVDRRTGLSVGESGGRGVPSRGLWPVHLKGRAGYGVHPRATARSGKPVAAQSFLGKCKSQDSEVLVAQYHRR
jgi:hypothetical protein